MLSRPFWAIVGVIVAIIAISWGTWALTVATSDVRGRGNAVIKVNDADNRLFAQGNFHDLFNEIKQTDAKLDGAATDKAAHPGDAFYETNYRGLVNHCLDAVGQYNSAAKKITQAKFRDEDLPYQIDPNDPKTDCKETQK